MSSSGFGMEVAEINEKSTIPELMGLLISSFQRKEFNLVERILIKREEELKTRLKKEQEERRLLTKIHGESELEKLEIQDDLKRLKSENLELQEEIKKLKREKLETAQKFLGYEERMTNLEKAMANVFRMDVSEIQTLACDSLEIDLQKEGNSNLDCKRTVENPSNHHEYAQGPYGVQSPSDGPWFEINSSHQEKKSCNDRILEMTKDLLIGHSNAQIGIEDASDTPKVGIDGLKQENENDASYAAASKSINRTYDRECNVKGQLVLEKSTQVFPSSKPISDRPRSPIFLEIIESDDEATGDGKPHISNTCSSEVNSSKKGVTFMESGRSGSPTQDKNKRNVRSNPLENLLLKRKRSLTETDDCGTAPFSKLKIETVGELLYDGKDSTVNNCSVKLESTATGSQSSLPYPQSQMVNEGCQGKAGEDCSLHTASRKLDFHSTDDSSDYSSSDSEDECSDSFINKMIESLRQDSRMCQKKWNFATDM